MVIVTTENGYVHGHGFKSINFQLNPLYMKFNIEQFLTMIPVIIEVDFYSRWVDSAQFD